MEKLGKQTIKFTKPPTILDTACIVGPKEAEGPLAKYFDKCLEDEFWGEKTWEKAESKILKETVYSAVKKSGIPISNIDYCFAGDLLNQCISSSFGLRDSNIPFIGIFGACSTFVEGLGLGSVFIDGGAADNVICAASSHFCSAEKQFRFPLELGNQRPQSSQWTVTGSGAAILSSSGTGPFITHFTPGIITHFNDTGRNPSYYDAIITGDLGHVGKEILIELAQTKGFNIKTNYNDCGVLIFDKEAQDTHAGGSGCACCGTVFSGYLFNMLQTKKYKKILLIATGALMNSTSTQQGESIPGIAHAVSIEV